MKKILVIDDQEDNLISIKALLKLNFQDYEVLTVQFGLEGIAIAQEKEPDVILLDIIMPEMDGYEVCKKLKANEYTKHIPIILLTAIKTDSESRVKGFEIGADVFLSKPINPAELSAQVKVMLRIKNAEDKLRYEKADLEKIVKERTINLSESNEKLQIEVNERKKVENQIKASLKEKDLLLTEIHHRVKNNLQIVSSLLGLQSLNINDEVALSKFKDCANRIRSMGLVHEKLYQSNDFSKINFDEYLPDLVQELLSTYDEFSNEINFNIQAQGVAFGINSAIPCGFIITECVTNSIKHAFRKDKKGEIDIEVKMLKDRIYSLTVKDNGIGLPDDLDVKSTKSLGFYLMNALVKQLKGEIKVKKKNGTEINIVFPRE